MLLIRISVGLSLSLKAPCLFPFPEFVFASGIVDNFLNKYSYSVTCTMYKKNLQQDDENGLYNTVLVLSVDGATPAENDSA